VKRAFIVSVKSKHRSCFMRLALRESSSKAMKDKKEDGTFIKRIKDSIFVGVSSFCSIGALTCIDMGIDHVHGTVVLAPFGATCFVLFTNNQSPFAQPRNVIGGHIIGASSGVFCQQLIPTALNTTFLAPPCAVATACALMVLLRAEHPPAAGSALMVALSSSLAHPVGPDILLPTALGSVSLVLMATLIHTLHKGIGSYPYSPPPVV
jgi:CBS-domain-containing membrane protein